MASAMGFFSKFRASASPEKRAIDELADLAGRKEALIARLGRHATRCAYPAMAAELNALAEKEAAHFKILRAILSDRQTWPRPPENQPREGASNWERLGGDLAILVAIAAGLRLSAMHWEAVDQKIGDTLDTMATEDVDYESDLRKLALKCDPQAFD
ncbi:MAG TPA: hypothetical protein VNF27_07815 [Candidatus Binataceae bacterium]|nr:hypothetical protein [Candidatus Binataceae bacterium]